MEQPSVLRTCGVCCAVVLWAALLGAGLRGAFRYASTPGAAGEAPEAWPRCELAVDSTRPTLVMFIHPQCPCSRASVAELAVIQRVAPVQPRIHVLVLKPDGVEDGWEQSLAVTAARAIPGAQVRADKDGALAARFGAATSGHLVLYDTGGRLRFSGGITISRGHQGDSPGRREVLKLLTGLPPAETLAGNGVFGCPLEEPSKPPAGAMAQTFGGGKP